MNFFKILTLRKIAIVSIALPALVYAGFHPTQGVQDGVDHYTGARPLRRNIEDLQHDQYSWSLFLQALDAIQNKPESQLHSYFQICGIHGRPYIPWDNVTAEVTYQTGYCTHSSVLFPTWHRPYLALFERVLWEHAQTISDQYQENAENWKAAARTLRLPYWDWASSSAIPYIVNQPTVNITTPSGLYEYYTNPLYKYSFPQMDPTLFPESLARTGTTLRDPRADQALAAQGLTGATYNFLTHSPDYHSFASQDISGASLEAEHGLVHLSVGGRYGHMSYLSYAAFDPIFWLHHTNCDRLLALYLAANPDQYIPTSGIFDPSYTFTDAPQTVFPSTPLTPFTLSEDGSMWTSDNSRYMSAFGYSYPEISDWNQSPSELAANVTAQINALYGPSSGKGSLKARHYSSSLKEWFVDISVDTYELDDQFIVWIFLGEVPADSGSWKYSTNLVGSLGVFPPPLIKQNKGESTSYGEVALRDALYRAGLPNQEDATLIEFLTKYLQWRVEKVDGTPVDPGTCKSLKVLVYDDAVTPPEDEYHFPTYGTRTQHPEITKGKVGGY